MICPLCQQERTAKIMEKEGAEIFRCYECTFVFAVMGTIPVAKGGDAEIERNDPVINALRLSRLGSPRRMLDFGCGHGFFVRFLREQEIYAVGIDVDTDLTLYTLKGSFDAITLVEVIEHLPNPVEIIKKLATHLTDKGVLYIESSFTDTRIYRGEGEEDIFTWWYLSPSKGHISFLNQRSMELLADKCGLTLVEPRFSANVFRMTR